MKHFLQQMTKMFYCSIPITGLGKWITTGTNEFLKPLNDMISVNVCLISLTLSIQRNNWLQHLPVAPILHWIYSVCLLIYRGDLTGSHCNEWTLLKALLHLTMMQFCSDLCSKEVKSKLQIKSKTTAWKNQNIFVFREPYLIFNTILIWCFLPKNTFLKVLPVGISHSVGVELWNQGAAAIMKCLN